MELLKDLWEKIKADAVNVHKSWTTWLNFISAALASLWLFLLSNPDALTQVLAFLPQLEGLLSPKVLTYITLGVNVVNFALRFKTDKALADK